MDLFQSSNEVVISLSHCTGLAILRNILSNPFKCGKEKHHLALRPDKRRNCLKRRKIDRYTLNVFF
jgi:hypothetical protein